MEDREKKCNRCGDVQSVDAFNNDATKRRDGKPLRVDGKYPYCKSCCAAAKRKLEKKWGAVWRERKRAHYHSDPATHKAKVEAYRLRNRAKVRAWQKAYALRHPEKSGERAMRHQARKRGLAIVPFSKAQLEQKIAYWENCCWMCGLAWNHIDHVKPLAKGGAHVLANLRPACKKCNTRKSAKWPYIGKPYAELRMISQVTKLGTARFEVNAPRSGSYFRGLIVPW